MGTQRVVAGVYPAGGFHWVGDGFRVAQIFPGTHELGERMSPFLLMDYHAPHVYPPAERARGVGVHPHRGFETVTLAFEGALAHHDSTGAGGVINPGDAQWMTAASGILHKEYHEAEWSRTGGRMHMMQLWVNLPAAHKMDPPAYQGLTADQMGRVDLRGGQVTVIAGRYQGVEGPARTHTPINLWRASLDAGADMVMAFPAEHNAAIFVMTGEVQAGRVGVGEHELAVFANEGEDITLTASANADFLVLEGRPIQEPVVAHGPFVMNTTGEIRQAMLDYQQGRFGHLA